MASGRIYFVPSRAEQVIVGPAPETQVAGTNLKRDAGETEDSLCDRVQLGDVNLSLVVTEVD